MSTSIESIQLLHLEDNSRDAELIADKLELEGLVCDIVHVDNRDSYESALNEGGFQIILADYNIPGYDGISALKLARVKQPHAPVIVISGALGEDDAVRCLQSGATDYLLKQRLDRLPNSIRQALAKAEEQQRRLQAEEALRESEARFRQLAEHSSDVFWFAALDPERIIYVSPAVKKVWGEPPEAFYEQPRRWQEAIHPDDRQRVRQAYDTILVDPNRTFEAEYRIRQPNGAERWILDSGTPILDSNGKVLRVGGMAKDITDRKNADEHIREQAEFLDKARDAICVKDSEGRITFWNKGAEDIYGWTATEALGNNASRLLSPAETTTRDVEVERALADEGEWAGEVRHVTKDGEQLTVESRLTLIRDRAGRPKATLAINTDISEKKKLAENLLRTQRLESIGTLAGGIAHDLNNALAPILMGLGLLQQKYPADHTILNTMEKSASRASEMVRQLLTFAKGTDGSEGKRLFVKPLVLLQEIEKIIQSTFPKNIELYTDFAPDLATILGDSTQLHQVLLNLCVNARDAMPDGGTLTLEAENLEIDEAFASSTPEARPGRYVVWRVTDTGTGIPPHVMERMFEPFFSTKDPDQGTGLGLSTLIGIVKSHEGFVRVYSVIDQGSTFAIHLPIEPSAAESESSSTELTHAFHGNGETILVVDDEAAILQVAETLLTSLNFKVITPKDATEALAQIAETKAELSVLITDLHMPHMDGLTLARTARRMIPQIGIIVSSGRLLEREARAFKALGTCALLDKPFTQKKLVEALQDVLPKQESVLKRQ